MSNPVNKFVCPFEILFRILFHDYRLKKRSLGFFLPLEMVISQNYIANHHKQ